MIKLEKFSVFVEGKKIINDLNMEVKKGELIVLMGPNGSGKSTLAKAIMGYPYKTKGKIFFEGKEIFKLSPDERARKKIFMSFQNPLEFEGLIISRFLRQILNSNNKEKISIPEFNKFLNEKIKKIKFEEDIKYRSLNKNFSGGEKKKMEMMQLELLQPKLAILDEIDSGLDFDSLRNIGLQINKLKNKDRSIILITHNSKTLHYLDVDRVFIFKNGRIIKFGGKGLAEKIEKEGFENIN